MELRDAYRVLRLEPGAPEELVRAAFRALSKRVHPDMGGTATEFRSIEEAFQTIERAGFPDRTAPTSSESQPDGASTPARPARTQGNNESGPRGKSSGGHDPEDPESLIRYSPWILVGSVTLLVLTGALSSNPDQQPWAALFGVALLAIPFGIAGCVVLAFRSLMTRRR